MQAPSVQQATCLLLEAEQLNPGPWTHHNRIAGECAKRIAIQCSNLDGDSAFVLGLLHDIGRRFGVTGMRHILDGYQFMMERGYDSVARICLTHSFPYQDIHAYLGGKNDCNIQEYQFIKEYIETVQYDDYDRLIQLCDALSDPTGACFIEKRLIDVTLRHGFNDLTVPKWREFLKLKEYFDKKAGIDIYKLIGVT